MEAEVADHTEVEWQFETKQRTVVARWLDTFHSHAVMTPWSVISTGTKEQDDIYFDTADSAVFKANYTCRVRIQKGGSELTLKSMSDLEGGGMRSRREVNDSSFVIDTTPLDTFTFLLGKAGTAARMLVTIAGKKRFSPLFTLHTSRRTFRLADSEGELGEIALDHVLVGQTQFARVEVEVSPECVERARPFVQLMVDGCNLTSATQSKFEVGWTLAGLPLRIFGGPEGETVTELGYDLAQRGNEYPEPGMTTAEYAFAIMRKQLRLITENDPGTRLGEDAEYLHDMRVATRRLRAAVSLFDPYIAPRLAPYAEQFRWLADSLGDVRDLDVQLERMHEWRTRFMEEHDRLVGPNDHGFELIEGALKDKREKARQQLLRILDTHKYEYLISQFGRILEKGPTPENGVPIEHTAPEMLAWKKRKFQDAGTAITPDGRDEQYHNLRIKSKKLRYALESFTPLYGEEMLATSKVVTALQDILGLYQDATTAIAMLRIIADEYALTPGTLMLLGAISERYHKDAMQQRAKCQRAFMDVLNS